MTTGRSAPVVLTTRSAATSCVVQLVPGRGTPFHSVGERSGPLEIAVEDDDLPCAGVGQVVQRFLGHLAGADHQHALVVEPLEDARGEIGDRHAGDAHAVAMERRFVGDAAGDAEGGLEQAVRHRPGAADFVGQFVGLLHLREDLRFAEDHAVEAGGDAEQVADDVVAFERHEFAADFVDRHVVEVGQIARRCARRDRRRSRRRRRRRARRGGRWRGARPRCRDASRARRPGRRRLARA